MSNLRPLGERAVQEIAPGMIVGLGTGKAATAFIHVLGERVRDGLTILGVPTSDASAKLAKELGIPLVELADVDAIDVDLDGADEVEPGCNLIKGYGGAMVREKIVAAASKRFVVLVGDEKLVPALGARGKLPVEVVPFGLPVVRRKIAALGYEPVLRSEDGAAVVTDNGNHIFDVKLGPIAEPTRLERDLLDIPGVVGTGLFLGMADLVLVQRADGTVTEMGPN
jgi:ribose 5-phosphate isomerase A